MSAAPQSKSGSNLIYKTSKRSYRTSSPMAVKSFLSTLRQAAIKSHALASHPDQTLQSLFDFMTLEQRTEAIGLLRQMNDDVGSCFVQCLRIHQSRSYSKMGFTTSHLSGGLSVLKYAEQHMIQCCCITPSNRKR